jgi:SagB-type dehydrogenase family enzyme
VRIKVSENVVFYWRKGQLICDDYVAHEQRALSAAAEPLLRWFSEWKDPGSLSKIADDDDLAKLEALAAQLLGAGILLAEGSDAHRREQALERWDAWGSSAKHFHFASRNLKSAKFLSLADDIRRLDDKAERYPPPPVYKDYPNADRIKLEKPVNRVEEQRGGEQPRGFTDVLLRRRTSRTLSGRESMTLDQLSELLFYVGGATSVVDGIGNGKVLLKTSPSGGARHAIELYPCVLNVDGVPGGFYHYSVRNHALELVTPGAFRDLVSPMCGGQEYVATAGVVVFYSAVVEREMWKYETARAYRVLMMDLGHLSQTFYLVAAWLGLGAFFTGALRDQLVEEALGVDWTEELVLGASGAGVPAPQGEPGGAAL